MADGAAAVSEFDNSSQEQLLKGASSRVQENRLRETEISQYNNLKDAVNANRTVDVTLVVSTLFSVGDTIVTCPKNIRLHFIDAGVLQIDDRQTVTIFGPISADAVQIFSFSGNGAVNFEGNASILAYPVQWFGVKGDGKTNDSPALQKAIDSMPNYTTLLLGGNGFTIRLESTINVSKEAGLKSKGGLRIMGTVASEHSAACSLDWYGPEGGTMLDVKSCEGIVLENFKLNCKAESHQALKGISMDKMYPGATMTDSFIRRVLIEAGGADPEWVGIHIAPVNPHGDNCENIRIQECTVRGVERRRTIIRNCSVQSGSKTLKATSPSFSSEMIGWLLTSDLGGGVVFNTVVDQVPDAMTLTLKDAAPRTATTTTATLLTPSQIQHCRITQGTNELKALTPSFTSSMVGWKVTVPGAGSTSVGYHGRHMPLNSIIDHVPDPKTLILRHEAKNTSDDVTVDMRAPTLSTGIKVGDVTGAGTNAFGIRFNGFCISNCGKGIWSAFGNVYCEEGFMENNDIDFVFQYRDELKTIKKVHSEGCYQFFHGQGHVTIEGCRIGAWRTPPDFPIVDFSTVGVLEFNQNIVEAFAIDCTIFKGFSNTSLTCCDNFFPTLGGDQLTSFLNGARLSGNLVNESEQSYDTRGSLTVFGNLRVDAGTIQRHRKLVTANYRADSKDDYIFVDATSGNIVITLPTQLATYYVGKDWIQTITIVRTDSSSHTVQIMDDSSPPAHLHTEPLEQFKYFTFVPISTKWTNISSG